MDELDGRVSQYGHESCIPASYSPASNAGVMIISLATDPRLASNKSPLDNVCVGMARVSRRWLRQVDQRSSETPTQQCFLCE